MTEGINMTLNDFLTAIFHTFADENDAENFGSTAFWRRQYEMWNSGIRGVDIHDQTCKVMAHYDGFAAWQQARVDAEVDNMVASGLRLGMLPDAWR